MTHWNRPPDLSELQELQRDTRPRAPRERRWIATAFAAGLLLVLALGFGTELFDDGPRDLDVSSAYRAGFDRGAKAAESYWNEVLEDAWWEGYFEGNADGSLMAPNLAEGVREGFSWDGGYEAGLQSEEINVSDHYWEGWMDGFNRGWSSVRGDTSVPQNADGSTPGGDS